MKFLIPYFLLIANVAHSYECNDPISSHINEAISHNKKVAKVYSELTDSESERHSYTLINLEKMTKLIAGPLDKEARIYHRAGIPVLCEEVPHMSAVPEFIEKLPENLRPSSFIDYDQKQIANSLKSLLKEERINEAYQIVASDLLQLESYPHQLCLTRHFLESIAHTLKLAERHRREASEAGLPDPLPLIKKYVSLQNSALILTTKLDKQVFPLQKEGLLIFCQDVPVSDWKQL